MFRMENIQINHYGMDGDRPVENFIPFEINSLLTSSIPQYYNSQLKLTYLQLENSQVVWARTPFQPAYMCCVLENRRYKTINSKEEWLLYFHPEHFLEAKLEKFLFIANVVVLIHYY